MSKGKKHERLKDYSVFKRDQGCVAGELDSCLGMGGTGKEIIILGPIAFSFVSIQLIQYCQRLTHVLPREIC